MEKECYTSSLNVAADPCHLNSVRSFIRMIAGLTGFSDKIAKNIVLAVDEACTNIIRHSYVDQTGTIYLECKVFSDKLEIVLKDYGKPVPECCIKSRKLKEVKPGGLGVYLIEKLMDEVYYKRVDDSYNTLLLVKWRDSRKEK